MTFNIAINALTNLFLLIYELLLLTRLLLFSLNGELSACCSSSCFNVKHDSMVTIESTCLIAGLVAMIVLQIRCIVVRKLFYIHVCTILSMVQTILKWVLFGSWFRNPQRRAETREKVSMKLHFKYGWTWEKCRNNVEMKEHKKTTLHYLLCIFADVG